MIQCLQTFTVCLKICHLLLSLSQSLKVKMHHFIILFNSLHLNYPCLKWSEKRFCCGFSLLYACFLYTIHCQNMFHDMLSFHLAKKKCSKNAIFPIVNVIEAKSLPSFQCQLDILSFQQDPHRHPYVTSPPWKSDR